MDSLQGGILQSEFSLQEFGFLFRHQNLYIDFTAFILIDFEFSSLFIPNN